MFRVETLMESHRSELAWCIGLIVYVHLLHFAFADNAKVVM